MELFPSNSNINFMRLRHVALALTAFICVSSLVLLATKGFNYALDFTGGTATEIQFEQPVDVDQLRERLEAAGFEGAVVQTFGSGNDIVVRLQPEEVSLGARDPQSGSWGNDGECRRYGRLASSASMSSRALGIRSCLLTPIASSSGQATKIEDSVPKTTPISCASAMPLSDWPP